MASAQPGPPTPPTSGCSGRSTSSAAGAGEAADALDRLREHRLGVETRAGTDRNPSNVRATGSAVTLTPGTAVTHGRALTVSFEKADVGTTPLRGTGATPLEMLGLAASRVALRSRGAAFARLASSERVMAPASARGHGSRPAAPCGGIMLVLMESS